MIDVRDELEVHCNQVRKKYPECPIVYAGIYGSQNYGLATPQSDVDSYVVIYPSWKMFATGNTHISEEVHLNGTEALTVRSGEHIVIKDVFTFYNELLKGGSMAIETVSSPYFQTYRQGNYKINDKLFYYSWPYVARKEFWYKTHRMQESVYTDSYWSRWVDTNDKQFRNLVRRYITQLNVLYNIIQFQEGGVYPSNLFFIEDARLHDAAADARIARETLTEFRAIYQLDRIEQQVFAKDALEKYFKDTSSMELKARNDLAREKIQLFQEYILENRHF